MNIIERFKDWYLGKHVGMSSRNGVFISGHLERPWLAHVVDWLSDNGKWVVTTLIALAALLVAYFRRC